MSEIKNSGLDQYVTKAFEQQQFGIAGVEGVKWFRIYFILVTSVTTCNTGLIVEISLLAYECNLSICTQTENQARHLLSLKSNACDRLMCGYF